MQNRQGYCSYCCVRYNNLEQHMSTPQHRYLTTQNRQRMGNSSLMERFLQDVLRHHPYHYQESRTRQNERPLRTNASPEVVPLDDPVVPVSEEMADEATGVGGEMAAKSSEPTEGLCSRPCKSQEHKQCVPVRPSVIQKLEKGQQQPLEFVCKVGSGPKEFNPVDNGQATNNGQNLLCPSVISTAPASRLPGRSYDRSVITSTARLPRAARSDSVSRCDPSKVERYLQQRDRASRNPMFSSRQETSSALCQKPKVLNRKSVCKSSDKSIKQGDPKCRGKALSTGFKSHAFRGTEGSSKFEPLPKLVVNPAKNLNKTDMPSNKGIFGDATPKQHEKFSSKMDRTQEGKRSVFSKSAVLKQKSSVRPKVSFACGSARSMSDQAEKAVQDLWNKEQIGQEDKTYESRGSEMSFDCSSSFYSLTGQFKVTAKERNLSKEVHGDLHHKSNKSCVSELSPDHNGPLRLATNRAQVIVKGVSIQKATQVRLVDESYDSSDSEMNFECDTSPQSANGNPQQPVRADPPKNAHFNLVDKNYGSSGSEISAEPLLPLQSVIERLPMAVAETGPQKKIHIGLVDMNYGSSCSETSFDCDVSPQSVIVHPQLAVKERNLKDRHVSQEDNQKSSSTITHLDGGISLETVTDEPQRAVEDINLPEEKNDLVDMNCEYYSPEMGFHTDAQLVADQPQVAVQEENPQEVAIDLQNKSAKSSVSDLSFNSHASLYQPANEPHGTLGEINLKELNVDMEVKSYGCSSSELTFDSDPPLLSVIEHSELDVELRKKHSNLEDESCGSNSSEITFDSDIPLCSVVDQSEVAEEEPIDQEYKNNEFCVSETAFDSDIPLPSRSDQPEVAVKEVIIPEEDCAHLGKKNDEPSGSEINMDYVPPLSVTNAPGVLVKRLNLQKKEQVHFESKENEPSGSQLSLSYGSFHSIIGHSENPIKEVNFQDEEQVQLENKSNGPSVPEIGLEPCLSHLVTDHPDRAVKEGNQQEEEHINLENKSNELSVSETSLDFGIPLQSVIQRTDVALKEMWLQKEKQATFKDRSAEFSDSEINLNSDVSHYSGTEPQIIVKEINVQKDEYVLENKSDKYSGSEIILDSNILPQLMPEEPQRAVLREDHVDPEDESTESRGFEINLALCPPRQSVIEQTHLARLKEKHVDLEDTHSESNDHEANFDSHEPLQPLTEQFPEVIKKTTLWKVEDISLENKVDKPNDSKLIQDSDVAPQSVPDQPEEALKQVNLENEGHVYLEDNNSQYSGSDMSLDSDYLLQSTVEQSQITVLEKEHTELEDKQNKSCGSEISFDSDDPLQSVADQLRETVRKISLWKDEVDVEEKRDESKGFEIMYNSDVHFQSMAGQTEEIIKKINLWKKPVDLEGKMVESSDSKINFDSDEPFHSVANEIQEATTEINLREGLVCLQEKGYESSDSPVIYVSNVPLQSAVEQPHILEEENANLEDKSNDLCGPEITFACDDPLQPVTDQLEKAVKVSLWKEDHIYLGDKSYKVGDFEVNCDSDAPIRLVVDPSPVTVEQINLQKKDHSDLENKIFEPSVSEIKCDSGIHLQLEVDQPQMVCKEMNLQRVAHLGMEEKTSDSEIMSDSDVPLQIVVNEFQVSVKEANPQKMLFVVTNDSDCEMNPDSDIPCQPVIGSPQMTVEGIDCINAKSFDLEGESYDCCDSEVGCVCEASPQSVSNQSRKTFKVVNQKKDYIILEEAGSESYGSEINFQIDASHQSTTCQSPGSDKNMAKYIDPEDKSHKSIHSPKRDFKWEATSQPVTHQLQKAAKEDNFWKGKTVDLKNKNSECGVSTVGCKASHEPPVLQMADEKKLSKLKHTDPKSKSCEPCSSGVRFQCDSSLQSDTHKPQKAVKKMSFDSKERNHNSRSSSAPKVGSVRNLKKTKGIKEDDTDEPVLEALPHVPPSFVGKTWSQIMREDDMKINALVKEFKEGRFHCYFDDDCETRKVKKKNLNEEKKITSTDLNDTAFIQILLDCDYNINDFSVALDKPSHHPTEKRPYEQTWRVASRCQAVKVSHGTQTNLMSYLVTKRVSGQQEDSPTLKRLLIHNDRKPKKKIEIGSVEFLESYSNILKPLHPNALVCVLSSNIKLKEGESFNFSKIRHRGDKNNQDLSIQYKYKPSSLNYFDPLNKKIVINPSLNIEVPESDRNNWFEIHFSDLASCAGDDDTHVQSSTSAPFMTVSVRHELMSHQGAGGSSVILAKSETLNSTEIPKESDFQLTLLNGDAAKTSPKAVRNKTLKSKKKVHRRKVTTNSKSGLLKKVCRSVLRRQKKRFASEKQSTWIQTKLNDIIRKYISKYSVFLRRKYQSRRAFIGVHLKKTKSVSRLRRAKRPTKILSNSAPSGGAENRFKALKSSLKQRVQASSSIAGNKRNGNKKRPRKKQRKRPKPIRIYDLRSLYSQVPYSDRMMTRLLHKLLLSKASYKYLY